MDKNFKEDPSKILRDVFYTETEFPTSKGQVSSLRTSVVQALEALEVIQDHS